jgi:hypothetical protein
MQKLINKPSECAYRLQKVGKITVCQHFSLIGTLLCVNSTDFPITCPLPTHNTPIISKSRSRYNCNHYYNRGGGCGCAVVYSLKCTGVKCGHYSKKNDNYKL